MCIRARRVAARPTEHRLALLAAALALVALGTSVLPAQASAAAPYVVTAPEACRVVRPASPAALKQFCLQIFETGYRANLSYERHYAAATRSRIRRVFEDEARRVVAGQSAIARLDRSPSQTQNIMRFPQIPLGKIKEFGVRSLTKLKIVVGGAVKFVPQVRVLRCGVFAALGAATAYVDGGDRQKMLVAAGAACIGSLIGDVLPSPKRKP